MSPIEEVSNIRRLPRLGKIRLGIKKEGQRGAYPQAVDYFVCPPEVQAVYGEKPAELKVMFPDDNLELIAPQYYKCYSYSQGLICKGDGKTCRRKVDVETGDFANKNTKQWAMSEAACSPKDCPMTGDKQCRKVMSLSFILPDVPGLGVYQLNTSSFYSIVNINSQLAPDGYLRKYTRGRIAYIPLTLFIQKQEVTPPGEGRKTVNVLNIRADVKLADIIRISRQRPTQVLLPGVEEEEPPDDLFPEEVIADGEVVSATVEEAPPTQVPAQPAAAEAPASKAEGKAAEPESSSPKVPKAKTARARTQSSPEAGKTPEEVVEDDIPDVNALFKVCNALWKNKEDKPMQPIDVAKELGYSNVMDLYSTKQTPWQMFQAIKAARSSHSAKT